MEGYGWVIFGGAVVFVGGLFAYLMLMIFLPEWVGITGQTALDAEASHRGPTEAEIAASKLNSFEPLELASPHSLQETSDLERPVSTEPGARLQNRPAPSKNDE